MAIKQVVKAAALAVGLFAPPLAAADGCPTVLLPSYQWPVVAPGWTAQLVLGGLTKPRSIAIDVKQAVLVVEAGKGISRHVFKNYGGTCYVLESSTLIINQPRLNHGIALSNDGTKLYASTVDSVYQYDYDASTGTVANKQPTVVVNNMGNNDLVTRTLLISRFQKDTLLVSRGSSDGNIGQASVMENGLSQIRSFSLAAAGSRIYNYNTDGTVLGWGLRNSVGVGEHPVTGGIYAVENSIDGVTRDGKDVHENNPGEELNFLGYLNGTRANLDKYNYGYPKCFAVWEPSEIPNSEGLSVGNQFAITENSTLTDETCAKDYVEPRLTFGAHQAPLDIKFGLGGTRAYITFRGSFDRTQPVGYRLASVEFNDDRGEPKAAANSKDALTDIMTNVNNTVCPDKCFRPVGLAVDFNNVLWMTSDSTGEIYVLQRSGLSTTPPETTGTGLFVNTTSQVKNAASRPMSWDAKVLRYVVAAVMGAWFVV
ncbi:hypothetical protein B0H63DRAFT_196153 [Podospora didyma]|uniref:Pyrroloquinoline quinone-dependent pyranose dehydrogenase beta-propeller domain-containing protein n=1 Tax=Podospora didyma TaxID=330526 RepID=A0AAE0TVL8_9PEZI|nr:hypothetical protein B0H63DRAFT_196153 [Podospora didyma]